MYRNGGVCGLYAGYRITLMGIVPYMAVQFAVYRALKHAFIPSPSQPQPQQQTAASNHIDWRNACVGFCAGVGSKFLTQPFDLVKKRSQVAAFAWEQSIASTSHAATDSSSAAVATSRNRFNRPIGIVTAFQSVIANEGGIRALWKGSVPSLLKAGPTSALTWMTYEACVSLLTRSNH